MDSPIESAASVKIADLDVTLDHPNRLFAPGDTITGSVHGWDPSTGESSLEISLQGRSKTYIQPGNGVVNKDRSLLTYQTTRLEPSDHVGSSIAKFSLTVPLSVEENPSDLAKKINDGRSYWRHSWPKEDPAFESSGGHRLPPSMSVPHREPWRGDPMSAWGHIQYTVTATVSQGEGDQTSKTESYPETVRISGPPVTVEELEPFKGVMRKGMGQLCMDRKKEPKKKTFSWYVRSALKLYPLLWLAPTIKVPRYAVVGDDIKISIQLQPSPAEYRFDLPPISLHRVTARIRDTAGIRGKRTPLGGTFELELPGGPSASKTWTTKHLFNPAEDGRSYQNAPCQVTFQIPRSCIPTFKTYNLYMKWNVAVELVLRGLDQEKMAEVESEIDLVPRLRGITTDEELDEDVVDPEAPGVAHNATL
ncbi:uncharacterized protein CDV56_105167 [Aspergillus thermomutatus]|uniref:Arrestin-like N-terminal domain-containing protein n=1 Tax=Aspergillus thermomutatus TaxID=41047 RepID=A0A397HH93_ASPTH|nr:uncharacterized protein CDV56_105167 [Aspergillus thermomutatus]RHZ62289.1 hypothetical protein CDV56_105167 [Aspergillus thermomutatus]